MSDALIPADVRSRLQDLRLNARRAIGARGIGLHRSRSRGAGLEFAQYRAYEPGDEPRQIDWKLYARSDRFFVREAERESPLTAWLLVDASASMAQADRAHPQWSRLDAARGIAACIAELALLQGDRFGLVTLAEDALQLLPAAQGARARDRLWLALRAIVAKGGFPQGERLDPIWERIAAGDLVVVLSDGFDDAVVALAERLAAAAAACGSVASGRSELILALLPPRRGSDGPGMRTDGCAFPGPFGRQEGAGWAMRGGTARHASQEDDAIDDRSTQGRQGACIARARNK